jgi:hypothetical protein
MPPRDK